MANVVIMPKQGLQMTEGTIISWKHKEGEEVKANSPLFEMETDKLTITIDSDFDGTLLKIIRQEGEVVPITEPIAIIGTPGEDISSLIPAAPKAEETPAAAPVEAPVAAPVATAEAVTRAPGERVFITPRAKKEAEEKGIDYKAVAGTGPNGLIVERDIKATPVAKKIAEIEGINLAEVQGTGVNGKIMKADVLRHRKSAADVVEDTIIPITGMRKAIFENMMNSLKSTAQANHRIHVDMSEVVRLRNSLKANDIKVSYNDILSLAVSKALIKYPCINATVVDNTIHERHYVNLGIAVAVENGLMVPNIKNADLLTLGEIAEKSKELIAKTRDGKLTMEEYNGGTFTITSLGMFDIDEFTPVINYPEAAILGVGKIADAAVVVDGAVAVRPMMTLSLTYDHRIINGAPAAEFLQYVKKLLQNPYLML